MAMEELGRITSGGGGGGHGGTMVVVVLPHELVVVEVLTRLPVKSLMRFKCVSNLWRSTISQDPSFSKAYRHRASSRSAGFFITFPDADNSVRCFYATLPPLPLSGSPIGGAVLVRDQFTTTTAAAAGLDNSSCNNNNNNNNNKYNGATAVVNGLFCLYAGNRSWICNVSTREIKELPRSPWSEEFDKGKTFEYHFGFVAAASTYKLLKFCSVPKFTADGVVRYYYLGSEILTLGGNNPSCSWRRLWMDGLPLDIRFHQRSIFLDDGYICCFHQNQYQFIVINLEDESFRVIDPPPKPSGSSYKYEDRSSLLQFRGHFALLRADGEQHLRRLYGKLEIWVLHLNKKYQQGGGGSSSSSSSSYEWISHVIDDVPYDFPYSGYIFLGNLLLPTGDRLLFTSIEDIFTIGWKQAVYSYDQTTGKFEKISILGKLPSWSPSSRIYSVCLKEAIQSRICYYEEDITPLSDLVISNQDSSPTAAASCTN